MDEKNVIILTGDIPCMMLKKLTSHYLLEMTTIFHHTYMDAALQFAGKGSQYCAVSLNDFICNFHFQRTSFA
jgi:hypothetical protein